jgi:ligand-binding sensor domain-containing protein
MDSGVDRVGRTSAFGRALLTCTAFLPFLFCLAACGSSGILSGGGWQAGGLQNQQLRVLAVNGKDLQNLYVGNAQGHIFASTDAGQRWSERSGGLPLPDPISALSFDASNQKLYAATSKGLFTTTVGAAHWSALSASGLPIASFTALAFDTGPVIYAGTASQGVYRSDNNGSSWTTVGKGLPAGVAVNELSIDSVQHQLWAVTAMGAYRSDDRGALWQVFNRGLPTGITINTIVAASTVGGTTGLLYMGTNHGIYFSQDSGAQWSAPQEALPGTSIHAILLDFRSTNVIALDIATDVGVFRSADNGQSWSSVASGLPRNASIYALAFGSTNYAQLYAAGSGIYLFPGSGGGIAPTRILPLILVVAFFFLLYWLSQRGRNRKRATVKSALAQEDPIPKTDAPPTANP